jgi:hypothetical protein
MTRRHLFDLTVAGLAGTCGCSAREPEMTAKVVSMAERLDLAIVPVMWTGGPTPEAIGIDGKSAAKLLLPEGLRLVSVSPDCGWIAWALDASQPPPIGTGDAKVFFTDAQSPIKTMQLERGYPRQLSLSSDAGYLALTELGTVAPKARLIVLNPRTQELQRDLSDLITSFPIADINRLRISANGQCLAVGTRERFMIVEVQAGRVLLEKEGQLHSLSPDGDFVAFINNAGVPAITSLITRASTELALHWRTVVGFGPWSPDGAFLLAGIRGGFSVFTKLAVVDCATGDFKEIVPRVVEGDRGEHSAWVKRQFLS